MKCNQTALQLLQGALASFHLDGLTNDDDCGCDGSCPCEEDPTCCYGAYKHKYAPAECDEYYSRESCSGDDCPVCRQWRDEP